ncbi:hypothetical protein HanOQP8_Chr02g0076291 [Helianthus annuus]|nr:hypothetical protein HanLR1_Chr02g0065341 [Helianthus annuus]KAJ0786875.1 hypothetical protein HanOQP8_Chr02g0076291 [Helianthus annuus]
MNDNHRSLHPVEAAPLPPADGRAVVPPRVRMKVIQGMPGTIDGLSLQFYQFAYAVVSFAVMASTSDFPSVTAFWCCSRIMLPIV